MRGLDDAGSYTRAKEIFLEAIEREDLADRDRFVQQSCGSDADLQRLVRVLLDAHAGSDGVLDVADELAEATTDRSCFAKPNVDRYDVGDLIGEGGMGLVYHAVQREPVVRQVAIKILKPGLDSREVLSRFRIEQHALARMEHANIAKVFDAGQTENGYPFIAMELVDGDPITAFCDRRRLHPLDRLRLFLQVCAAVSHAHQRGILHRDLKPSNILVCEQDNVPVPKVIDFGLARAIEGPLSGNTRITSQQRVIGTPRYMSPEQSRESRFEVDVRSDVYSLGTILYELLTGLSPKYAKKGGRDHAAIGPDGSSHDSVVKPSSRLAAIDSERSKAISAKRSCSQQQLAAILRRDLDWIMLKSLEYEPQRRYESVAAFAEDIRRYLNDDPIEARPPSLLYRASKLSKRHRTALTVATFAVATLAFFFYSIWRQSIESQRGERRMAALLTEVEKQRDLADLSLYVSDVRFAAESLEDGDVARALGLLSRQVPSPEKAKTGDLRDIDWYYVHDRTVASRSVIAQLDTSLQAITLDPLTGQILVAGNSLTRLELDGSPVEIAPPLTIASTPIQAAALSPSGDSLAFARDDGSVRLLELQSGQEFASFKYPGSKIYELCFTQTGNELIVSGNHRDIPIFDIQSGETVQTLRAHQKGCEAIAISPSGDWLASGSDDKSVVVSDWRTGEKLFRFRPTENRVTAVAFAADGNSLICGDIKGEVQVWSLADQKRWMSHRLPSAIESVAVSPNGTIAAFACRAGAIHLLPFQRRSDVGTAGDEVDGSRSQRSAIFAHEGRVTDLLWLDQDRIASVGQDGTVVVSNIKVDRLQKPVDDTVSNVIALSNNGKWLVAHDYKSVRLIDLSDGRMQSLAGFFTKTNFAGMAFAPDDSHFIVGTADGEVQIAEVANLDNVVIKRPSVKADYSSIRFSDDGSRLMLFSGGDDTLIVLDYPSWELRFQAACPDAYTGALSPDGRYLATSFRGDVLLYDLDSGDLVAESKQHHTETINDLRFGPNGDWLATTSDDRTIKLWDFRAERVPKLIDIFPNGVPRGLAISSSGRVLFANSRSGEVWAFHVPTRQRLFPIMRSEHGYFESMLARDDSTMVVLDGNQMIQWMELKQRESRIE